MRKETAEKQLHHDVLSEHNRLAGLVSQTKVAVGDLAHDSYSALIALPQTQPPLHIHARLYDKRFFKAWNVLQRVEADVLPAIPNDHYAVVRTESYAFRRAHGRAAPVRGLQLPITHRGVDIGISKTPVTARQSPDSLLSITTDGTVACNLRTDFTAPRKHIPHPRSFFKPADQAPENTYYENRAALRDDYAAVYSGALAVAGTIGRCLSAQHGIQTDIAPLQDLIDAWQDVRMSDAGRIAPTLVPILYPDLATQAGAVRNA
jgi:hypothetical protein